jgi:hypothetical protein|eukprot:Transcript_25294.p4 GENE.Transcript_25294~~Transcript_25294.p4  ORF type:complete len:183 (+),score=69.25 Transcript_25294:570-1118(+)
MLRSCTWGIAGDLHRPAEGEDEDGGSTPSLTPGTPGTTSLERGARAGAEEAAGREELDAAMAAAPWLATDWVVLRFAAKSFAPQQVRRMAGVVAAVVSGAAPPDYLERCFGTEPVPTPLLPAEHMWLAALQLLPDSEEWRGAHLRPDPTASARLRTAVEESATRGGVRAWMRAGHVTLDQLT